MNSELIIRTLRGGQSAAKLINEDAGALTERVITRANVAGYREVLAAYLAELYKNLAAVLESEHNRRLELQLDGAEARSHQAMLLRLLNEIAADSSVPDAVRERARVAAIKHADPLNPVRT